MVTRFPNTVTSWALVLAMNVILELEKALVCTLLAPSLGNYGLLLETDENYSFED